MARVAVAAARGAAAGAGPRSCRVAVVGGGPAGVVTCRFLAEAGHHPTVFEYGSEVGGIWAPEPTNNVVYRGLVTNIPTVAMQSFDLDFPPGLPSYIGAADLGRYVADYATHFNLRSHVRFGRRVTHIEALRSEEEEAGGEAAWRVRWQDHEHSASCGGDAAATEPADDQFDAVVVASGHYEFPYQPEVPGQAAWLAGAPAEGSRTVVHAREYNEPAAYRARVVLVVGGRSSAVDIARELRGEARWVYVLEKGCREVRAEGPCTHVPLGTRLGPDGRLTAGGQPVEGPPVEDVVLATGYRYAYPFLDAARLGLDHGPDGRWVEPLYMHIVHARRPSLTFVGVPLAVPTPIPLFEAQARFIAAHLRDGPSAAGGHEAWVEARRAEVGDRPQDLHFLGDDAWDYMRELTRMSGFEGADYEAYCRRLALVQAVYKDRVVKRPRLPWGDDWYRRCEYSVDWEAGTWQVKDGHALEDLPAAAASAL